MIDHRMQNVSFKLIWYLKSVLNERERSRCTTHTLRITSIRSVHDKPHQLPSPAPVDKLPRTLWPHFVFRDTFLLQEGRGLASAALGHLQSEACEACRIALVHNPAGSAGAVSLQGRAALAASRLQSRRPKIGAFLAMLMRPGSGELLRWCV